MYLRDNLPLQAPLANAEVEAVAQATVLTEIYDFTDKFLTQAKSKFKTPEDQLDFLNYFNNTYKPFLDTKKLEVFLESLEGSGKGYNLVLSMLQTNQNVYDYVQSLHAAQLQALNT